MYHTSDIPTTAPATPKQPASIPATPIGSLESYGQHPTILHQSTAHSLAWGVVVIEVVPAEWAALAPEDEMLLSDDDDEERGPVAEDAQEVRQDLRKMLAPRDPRDGVRDKGEEDPDEARDHRERASEGLHGDAGGVRVRDVVPAGIQPSDPVRGGWMEALTRWRTPVRLE